MPKPIACIPTGVHLGSGRFPNRHDQPKMKAYRCDLTALSQVYNFYFVACNDTVHVYRPSFPDQNLAAESELILHPPTSPVTGRGIDPEDPHSITRLHVDYLGQDEILLVACDDGDIIGYRIEELHKALERQTMTVYGELEPGSENDIKIFLRLNMGASAWGLAVHREARMIAISANTHQVTVLAYALAPSTSHSDTKSSSEHTPATSEKSKRGWPSNRLRDHTIILSAGSNIPSVSFNNNGDDPSGRWLFSSSIDGRTMLWDLHHPREPARIIQMGWCASTKNNRKAPIMPLHCACTDHANIPHGAWGAMFLDTRSAYEMSMTTEKTNLEPWRGPPCFVDITESLKWFYLKDVNKPPSIDEIPSDDDYDSSDMMMQLAQSNESEDDVSNPEVEQSEELHSDADSGAMSLDGEEEDGSDETGVGDEDANDNGTQAPEELSQDHIEIVFDGRRPYCEVSSSFSFDWFSLPVGPCLIITKEEIYLYQRPFHCAEAPSSDPIDRVVSMQRPLHPGSSGTSFLGWSDRMCYFTQIPELGVFVVASPVGRAGVFSIYWTKEADTLPQYGFRLEYLLPFETGNYREVSNVIPGPRLVGVAVGPVQGMFDRPEDPEAMAFEERLPRSRRWRLLMYYMDHTILSFELSKRRAGESPSLGELVV